jgi:hypothetical protein
MPSIIGQHCEGKTWTSEGAIVAAQLHGIVWLSGVIHGGDSGGHRLTYFTLTRTGIAGTGQPAQPAPNCGAK